MQITGTVRYQTLEGGFWSIIADDGTEYLPIGIPEQLKHEGKKVKVQAALFEGVSMMMWGTAITIHSFHTMMP